ncbi:hypothetical protein HHL22_11475 [Hymenobacter sp. RP-2-7]|uniref:Uncharacterized protein n=1 Tax=Hymenobacter polaris TaxID=2682546 RepID=A0A7Y0AED3_9BACT|nr:hypothetical protein [Hymenobacter polaris]NML65824.1 hypothetical protein [Hymenobacter polaris]
MATHHEKKNQLAAAEKNTPGLPEVHKGDALPNLERDEATQERLEDEAEDAGVRHPNRGYNKPDNGKGSY